MHYCADTHAFLWHLYLPERLGKAARAAFSQVDQGNKQIVIPAVVVAEALMVAEKRRIPGVTSDRLMPFLRAAKDSQNYILTALSTDIVLASGTLQVIPDIFDRLIATEARHLQVPLITRDPVIVGSGLVSTIWDD